MTVCQALSIYDVHLLVAYCFMYAYTCYEAKNVNQDGYLAGIYEHITPCKMTNTGKQ